MLRSETHTPPKSDGDGLGMKAQRSCSVVGVPQETAQGWEEQHFGEGMGPGKGWARVPMECHTTHWGGAAIYSLI